MDVHPRAESNRSGCSSASSGENNRAGSPELFAENVMAKSLKSREEEEAAFTIQQSVRVFQAVQLRRRIRLITVNTEMHESTKQEREVAGEVICGMLHRCILRMRRKIQRQDEDRLRERVAAQQERHTASSIVQRHARSFLVRRHRMSELQKRKEIEAQRASKLAKEEATMNRIPARSDKTDTLSSGGMTSKSSTTEKKGATEKDVATKSSPTKTADPQDETVGGGTGVGTPQWDDDDEEEEDDEEDADDINKGCQTAFSTPPTPLPDVNPRGHSEANNPRGAPTSSPAVLLPPIPVPTHRLASPMPAVVREVQYKKRLQVGYNIGSHAEQVMKMAMSFFPPSKVDFVQRASENRDSLVKNLSPGKLKKKKKVNASEQHSRQNNEGERRGKQMSDHYAFAYAAALKQTQTDESRHRETVATREQFFRLSLNRVYQKEVDLSIPDPRGVRNSDFFDDSSSDEESGSQVSQRDRDGNRVNRQVTFSPEASWKTAGVHPFVGYGQLLEESLNLEPTASMAGSVRHSVMSDSGRQGDYRSVRSGSTATYNNSVNLPSLSCSIVRQDIVHAMCQPPSRLNETYDREAAIMRNTKKTSSSKASVVSSSSTATTKKSQASRNRNNGSSSHNQENGVGEGDDGMLDLIEKQEEMLLTMRVQLLRQRTDYVTQLGDFNRSIQAATKEVEASEAKLDVEQRKSHAKTKSKKKSDSGKHPTGGQAQQQVDSERSPSPRATSEANTTTTMTTATKRSTTSTKKSGKSGKSQGARSTSSKRTTTTSTGGTRTNNTSSHGGGTSGRDVSPPFYPEVQSPSASKRRMRHHITEARKTGGPLPHYYFDD